MKLLNLSLFSLFLAQFIKVFTTIPPDLTRLIGSGGMPSSHSAFVAALTTQIGLKYGFDSDLFAIVLVFSLIILYDAGGVRRAVGEQANVLNRLIQHLDIKQLGLDRELLKQELKELIGHTPFEVIAGTLLGIAVALLTRVL
ncbi:MAG: divergent PAP2 family protein [Bacillota bacterium]